MGLGRTTEVLYVDSSAVADQDVSVPDSLADAAFEVRGVSAVPADVAADCVVVDTERTAWRGLVSDDSRPVVVTGPDERALPAFRAGAADFVPRGGDLAARVRVVLDAASRDDPSAHAGRSSVDRPSNRTDAGGLREVALDAASSLLSATPDELDAKIEFTLESLCDQLQVPRAATYLTTDDGYERRHATAADEPLAPTPHDAWLGPLGSFQSARYGPHGCHDAGRPVEPRDRSGVVVPLVSNWELAGCLVFDDPAGRRWSDEEVQTLETVGELTAQALARRRRVRELRAQNDRLEQFASVVSHDLRNPLNAADGWLELARSGNQEAFDRIDRSLGRMEALIEDVLTLAREGADVGELEPVAVESVARRAWSRVSTEEASLDVTSVGEIEADESRLASLFENLFRNSVEHAGSDVAVRVGPTETGFYVADDGPGLSAEPSELFEWGTTTGDGTGLGLAIVEQVATGHGWTVSARSDGGARFEFDLDTPADAIEA